MRVDREHRVVVLRTRDLEHRGGNVLNQTVRAGRTLQDTRHGRKVRRNLRKIHAVVNPIAAVYSCYISIS